jgi:hypothetical protein
MTRATFADIAQVPQFRVALFHSSFERRVTHRSHRQNFEEL